MSSRMSMYRRVMGMAGAGALALGGVGAVIANSGVAYASPVASSTYTIGYPLSGVTFAASNSVATDKSVYTVNFTVPSGDSSPNQTVYLSGLPGQLSMSTTTATDVASGSYVVEVGGTVVNPTSFTYDSSTGAYSLVLPSGTLAAGDAVSLTLSGANGSAGTYTPAVSLDAYSGTASNVTISPTSVSANASASASSNVAGAGAVSDSFSGFVLGNSSSSSSLHIQLSQASQSFPSDTADYTVKVTSGSTTSTDAVTSVTDGNGGLTNGNYYTLGLSLQNSVPADATVSVQVTGVTNLSYTSPTYVQLKTSAPSADLASTTLSADLAEYLQPASLTSTLQVSDSQQGSPSNWTDTFTLPSGYTAAATGSNAITPTLNGATWAGSWALIVNGAVTTGTKSGGIALPSTAAAGNSVTLELFGVTNPDSSTAMLGLTVASDTGASSGATSYSYASQAVNLTAAPSTANVVVTPSSDVPGASVTYTITGLAAAEALTGGASGTPIHLVFPAGTVLPTANSDYTLTDLTSSSSSGVYSVTYTAGGEAGVTILPANNIASGDNLMITISGVTNPPSASATDVMTYGTTALMAATQQATATSVPTAAATYPNGALILSGGQIDVVAGGYAFGIPNPTVFSEIKATDMSKVVSGSFPTSASPAPGTLIHPVGSAGIWVVGNNGEIYQFSSMSQFMQEGYSMTQVVPVPAGAAGLVAGVGTPPRAAMTMANGALVQFGKTVYEYAGGVPTGIATEAELSAIQKVTGATVVMGSGSTATTGTVVTGALVHPLGTSGIWVSVSNMTLEQFSSASQFTGDGYSFQYVLPVASTAPYTTN